MFEIKIIETYKPLSTLQRISTKRLQSATKIDEELDINKSCVINADNYVILRVTTDNPKFDTPEYDVLVIIDTNGEKYITSSEYAIRSFIEIVEELRSEDESISAYAYSFSREESNNYKGKYYILCNIQEKENTTT